MTEARPAEPKTDWSRRLKVWGGITVAVLIGLLIGAAFIPRWWAQRVGDQANESFTGGIMLGLFYGFVFTVLPLLADRLGNPAAALRAGCGCGSSEAPMLLALPNLFTLGIALGLGSGAHAGDRTLDVEAPGFRGATLGGALLALAAVGFVWYLLSSRRRARRALRAQERPRSLGGQASRCVPSHPRPSGAARLSGRGRCGAVPDSDPRRHPLRLGGRPPLAGLERAGGAGT